MTRRFPGVFRVAYRNRRGHKQWSRTWFIRYSHKGKQFRESTGSTDPEKAWDIRLQRLREIGEGSLASDPGVVTAQRLRDLVHANLDARGKVTAGRIDLWFAPLVAYFGTRPMKDVKPADLEAYVSARKKQGVAPGSVSVELAWLRRGFRLAQQSDLLAKVPAVPKIEFDNARRVFADWPVVERLLPLLPASVRPVVLTAHFSGWRKESILNRERALHLDLEGRWLYLERSANKGRSPVRIWLNDVLLMALREQDEIARGIEVQTGRMVPWLFFYHQATTQHQAGDRLGDITKQWEDARTAAGFPGLRFHDLRRGAIRDLRRSGSSEHEVMNWVGIRTRSVFDRYDLIDEDRIRDIGERQEAFHKQKTGLVADIRRKG